MKEVNQSGEDFLHEAKVSVFDVSFNIPLPSPFFDYRPMHIITDKLCVKLTWKRKHLNLCVL